MTRLLKQVRYRNKRTRLLSSLTLMTWVGIMILGTIIPPTTPPTKEFVSNTNKPLPPPVNQPDSIDDFPRRGAANEPNLTRIMHPFILKMSIYTDLYNVLAGLNDTNIRVAYYDENYIWKLVPFQIDEVGCPLVWQDSDGVDSTAGATLKYKETYIPYGDPYGSGNETNPGHLDSNDELVFYAYNGRQVDITLWWNSTSYPNRTEVKIYDPVDGGQSWMYIYFNPSQSFEPISVCSWYVDYVNWSVSNLRVETPIYRMGTNSSNPNLTNEISIQAADGSDMVTAFGKTWTRIYVDAGFTGTFSQDQEGQWPSGDGFTNPGFYSFQKSAIDNPTDTYTSGHEGNLASAPSDSNNIEGAGDHNAVIDGPVRVIVGKSTYSHAQVTVFIITIHMYSYGYGTSFYYYSMTQGDNGTTTVPTNADADLTVLYTYQAVVQMNNTVRSDYQINYGAEMSNPNFANFGSSRMKICRPDGTDGNDGYNEVGDPTLQGSSVPDLTNPDLPDWIFINSTTHGGMWMNVPRDEMEPLGATFDMYWHDSGISETGLAITNIAEGASTDPYYTRVIFGEFKNIPNMNFTGSLYYNQSKIQLTGISTFSQQYVPPGKPVFNSITPDSVVYKDGQSVTLSILCDHAGYSLAGNFGTIDSGFGASHNATWVDNGGGSYTMNYNITETNTRSDGVYTINITAWNVTTGMSSTSNATQLELYNNIAVVTILNINAVPSTVYPGDTNLVVNVTVNNTGGGPLNVTGLNLKFYNGGKDNAANYTVSTPWPKLPYRINNLSSAVEFTFNVSVKPGTLEGLTYINATADAIDLKLDTPIHDTNGSITVDSWTVNVGSAPAIVGPGNQQYTIGTTGHTLAWNITDLTIYNPTYVIYKDAVINRTESSWSSGVNVTLNLDPHNLPIGEYNYTLVANDGYNKIVQNVVIVTIINIPPSLDEPSDVNYEPGTTGNKIIWTVTDNTVKEPTAYNVYKDTVWNCSGSWTSGNGIQIDVDGLSDGNYNWTIIVDDGYGGMDSNEVRVIVTTNPAPSITQASHIVYQSGATGNLIQWTITDSVVDTDATFWVYRNGSQQNSSSWASGFVIIQNVDGPSPGYWNWTLVADDGYGVRSQDEAIVTVNIPPVIITPPDQSWNFGTPGQWLYWTVIDNTMNPPTPYTIYCNGSSVQANNWVNNTQISYSLASPAAGRWNYTIVASDNYGGTSSDQVWVVVNDQPYISGPIDQTFDHGELGHTIAWTIVDNITFTPSYTVYRNQIFNESNSWSNNSVITIYLNGLGVGDWNFSIFVDDGNWNRSDEVWIHVENVAPIITPHTDVDMALGSTGNDLDWSITDASTNDPRYDIYHNKTLNVTNAQWLGNPIIHNVDDLALGWWNITIIFRDGYGGTCFDEVWVNVTTIADAEDPTVNVTTPTMDAYLDEYEIQVTGYANGTGSNINLLQVNNTLFSFTVTPLGTLEGPYTLANNSVVTGGYYVLNITVSDAVNRKAWVIISFYVDVEAPTFIGLENYALGAIVVNCGTSVTISIEVTEETGVDIAELSYQMTGSAEIIPLSMILLGGNYTATIPGGVYKQAVYFRVSITDLGGHICASPWYNYTIGDQDKPVVSSVVFSIDLLSILEGDAVDIAVGATDTSVGSGVRSVTMRYSANGGETYTEIRLIQGSDGNFKGSLPNLAAGTAVNLQVVVEDIAGNVATANYEYTVGAKSLNILSILTSPFTIVFVGIFLAFLILVMRRRRGAEVRRLFGESGDKGTGKATV